MSNSTIKNTRELYAKISSLLLARENCEKSNMTKWRARHTEAIAELVKAHCPSGSGFDSGTKLDLNASKPEKLVFLTAFHHMNENGMYDGWTQHTVTIRPSLWAGYHVSISGRDRNQIKDYIGEMFSLLIPENTPTPPELLDDDTQAQQIGEKIVDLFGLKPIRGRGITAPNHYQTEWGTKTSAGLARTLAVILSQKA